MLLLAATLLLNADVVITLKAGAITTDGKPLEAKDFSKPTDEMCTSIGGPVSFADKNKPVPVIETPEQTPWREVKNVLTWVKACDFEQVRLRHDESTAHVLRLTNPGPSLALAVDKKAKLAAGSTLVDFSAKDLDAFKIALDPDEPLRIAAADATPVKAVTDLLKALGGLATFYAVTDDVSKEPALSTALGVKIAPLVFEDPPNAALLFAFQKAQLVTITKKKPPAWTEIENAVCLLDGRPMVWGVGVSTAPAVQAPVQEAEARARLSAVKLFGQKVAVDEVLRGGSIADHFADARGKMALFVMHAPDALKDAATAPCPTNDAEATWATKPITPKDYAGPAATYAKAGTSLVDGQLVWKIALAVSLPDSRIGGALARAQLATAVTTAALASPERKCLSEIAWNELPLQSDPSPLEPAAAAWLNVYDLRRQAVAKKCPTAAVTALIKDAMAAKGAACREKK